MADTQLNLKISDGGTLKPLISGSETFKNNMQAGAAALSKGRMPGAPVRAPRAGPAPAGPAPAGPAPAGPAGGGGSGRGQELNSYGIARGAVGTGAAGRDFAKQAQGLGGLVHLYATFAANLFAVSAAFTALKNAANTTNMIQGLDDLGAASGKSLSALSKQLVATTGGAISLKEAMTSVAQASSAGLGTKQINDIGVVAAKASNALGISMTDALSRLSRGISKIEPELLDELGIFVKVDDAVSKYAISVGKTVTSLSDFERRQAFANAVIDQGKEKFAAIAAVANPYDKLLASVSNLATSGLQLVNTVLNPILKILSESPVALGLVLTAITAGLIKQAIPALTNWRSALVKSAETSAATAKSTYENFKKYSQAQAMEAEAGKIGPIQAKISASMQTAQNALKDTLGKNSKILTEALAGNTDPAELQARVDREIKRRTTILDKIKETSKANTAASNEEKKAYDDKIAKQEKDLANLGKASVAYDTIITKTKEVNTIAQKSTSRGAVTNIWERMLGSTAQREQNKAIQGGILAQVGKDTQKYGPIDAWKALQNNIKNGIPILDDAGQKTGKLTGGLKGLSAASASVKGTFLIMGSTIGTALNALGPWIQVIGLLIAAYKIFDSSASNAAKEQEDFNSKIVSTQDAVKGAADTLELYTRKRTDAYSIEGMEAFSTAITGITDALKDQILALEAFTKKAGIWENFKDGLASITPGFKSNLQELTQSTILSAQAIAKTLVTSGREDELRQMLGSALNIPPESVDSIKAWQTEFNKIVPEDKLGKIIEVQSNMKKVADAVTAATASVRAFSDNLKEIGNLVSQVIQANQFTDLQGKLGVELVNASDNLAKSLQNPINAIAALAKLGKDPKALAALGGDEKTLNNLKRAVDFEKQLVEASKLKQKALNDLELAKKGELRDTEVTAKRDQINVAEKRIKSADDLLKDLRDTADGVAKSNLGLVDKLATEGWNRIDIALKRAVASAKITLDKFEATQAAAAGIDTSRVDYTLKMQEFQIQRDVINANFELEKATNDNTEALASLTAAQQIIAAKTIKADSTATPMEKQLADDLENSARSYLKVQALISGRTIPGDMTISMRESAEADSARKRDDRRKARQNAAMAPINAGEKQAAIEKEAKNLAYINKIKLESLELDKKGESLLLSRLNIASQLDSYVSKEYIDRKSILDLGQAKKDLDIGTKKIDDEIAAISKNSANYTKAEYKDQEDNLKLKKTQLRYEYETKVLSIDINRIRDEGKSKQAELARNQGIMSEELKLSSSIEEAIVSFLQKQLDIKKQLGLIDEQTANRQKAALEIQSQRIKFDLEQSRLKFDVSQREISLQNAKDISSRADEAAFTNPTAENFTIANTAASAQGAAATQLEIAKQAVQVGVLQNNLTIEGINLNTALNAELIAQKEHMDSIASLTSNLATIFGEFGKSLGGVVSAFDAFTEGEKKRASQLKTYDGDAKGRLALEKKLNRERIDGETAIISATKKTFKEKTFVYKTLGNMEKINSIKSTAISLKEAAVKSGLLKNETIMKGLAYAKDLAMKASNALKSIGIDIPAIYFKFMATMGPLGAAAAAAAIAAVLGGKGGGVSVPALTAEQQREAGDGQRWTVENGKNVLKDVGGGVWGDTEAKSESIANSIELMKDSVVDGLYYDDKMLKALLSINNHISGTASLLAGIPGISQGSAFGTKEGTTSSSSFFGAFSSSSTTEIINAGIQFKSTFGAVLDGLVDAVDYFETTRTTTSSGGWLGSLFGGGGGTSESTLSTPIADEFPEIAKQIKDSFKGIQNTLIEFGDQTGKSEEDINTILKGLNLSDITASLKGLKGQELAEEWGHVLSKIMDRASGSIFETIATRYHDLGEGATETVARVLNDYNKVNLSLESIGLGAINVVETLSEATTEMHEAKALAEDRLKKAKESVPAYWSYNLGEGDSGDNSADIALANKRIELAQKAYTEAADAVTRANESMTTNGYEISDALVEAAGGLDAFLERTQFFRDNFMTEAQKDSIMKESVTKKMAELGLSSITTRKQFSELYLTLSKDLSPSAIKLRTALDEVAPSFIKVAEAAGDVLGKEKDVLKQVYENRKKELESLISSWGKVNETVLKFIDSLRQGSLSTLTPQQKFALAEQEYNAALNAISDPTLNSEARLKAGEAFSGSADKLLQIGKTLYASSASYTSLFDKVIGDSNSVADQASALEIGFTTELSALNSIADTLDLIKEEATKSTNFLEALDTYFQETYKSSIPPTKDYFDLYPDVAESYKTYGNGMDESTFASNHYDNFGKAEGRVDPALLTGIQDYYNTSGSTATYLKDTYGDEIYNKVVDAYSSIYGRTGFGTTPNTIDVSGAEYWMTKILNKEPGLFSSFLQPGIELGLQSALQAYDKVGPNASFAIGTNYVPRDMIAQIHEGERIIPAADNAMLMQSFSNRNENERILVEEIRNLRKEVTQLRAEQKEQTGHLIASNYDANFKGADKVVVATEDAAVAQAWAERNKVKIA